MESQHAEVPFYLAHLIYSIAGLWEKIKPVEDVSTLIRFVIGELAVWWTN